MSAQYTAGSDVDLDVEVVRDRWGRREQERRFRQVRPAREPLHARVVEPLGVGHDGHRVAATRLCTEDIELGECAAHDAVHAPRRPETAVIGSHEVERHRMPAALERMQARLADRPVYVSIDTDVLDPAHAPGTGTPEAGGLTSRELLELLRELRTHRIVGADVVEVAPAYDHAQLTGIAASHVAYEVLASMSDRLTGFPQ